MWHLTLSFHVKNFLRLSRAPSPDPIHVTIHVNPFKYIYFKFKL